MTWSPSWPSRPFTAGTTYAYLRSCPKLSNLLDSTRVDLKSLGSQNCLLGTMQ